jgi:hypothetical protein
MPYTQRQHRTEDETDSEAASAVPTQQQQPTTQTYALFDFGNHCVDVFEFAHFNCFFLIPIIVIVVAVTGAVINAAARFRVVRQKEIVIAHTAAATTAATPPGSSSTTTAAAVVCGVSHVKAHSAVIIAVRIGALQPQQILILCGSC